MNRHKDLKRDTEKAREFLRRSRSAVGRRRRQVGTPQERRDWTGNVFRLYGAGSVVPPHRRATHAHHAIPIQVLLRTNKPALVWRPELGVPVTGPEHDAHHHGTRKIRHSELPEQVIEFARALGFGWYIDDPRNYP